MTKQFKIYKVGFSGVYPVGNCLIIAAYTQQQAEEIAKQTIRHTDKFEVKEFIVTEPCVIEYMSWDY